MAGEKRRSRRKSTEPETRTESANEDSGLPVDITEEEETVWRIAVNHCLFHYPTLYTPGLPELASSGGQKVWVVPLVLRFPTGETLGTVGEIRIDAHSHEVIGSTPSNEAVAKGKQLYEGKPGGNSAPVQPNQK